MAKAKVTQPQAECLPLSEVELKIAGERAAELARDIEKHSEALKEKKSELENIYSRIELNFPKTDELQATIQTAAALFTSKKEREYVVDADFRRKISNYLQSAGYEGEAHETEMARALGYFEEKHKVEVKIGLMASGRRLLEEDNPLARAVQSVITVNTKVKFEVQAL